MPYPPAHYVVIHHNNCCDGFTAAWIANRAIRNTPEITAEYIGVNYNESYEHLKEKIRGKKVLVFDFAFPRELMIEFNALAAKFEVFDHHKTGEAECAGLDFCLFDMTKSGAMLAWERMCPGDLSVEKLVRYVQDYDLWQFKMDESEAINAVVHATEKTFDKWDTLAHRLTNCVEYESVVREGRLILSMEKNHVESACKYASTAIIQGHRVPLINNPNLISKTLAKLALGKPFAAAFFMRKDGKFVFSLRSNKDTGLDVSKIAEGFPGGGGHKNAAGFTISINDFTTIWDTIEQVEGHP